MSVTPISLKVNACLFDVDGTIIISQPAIAEFWKDFGKDKPYFDTEHVIKVSHGCRTLDVLKEYAPDFATQELANQYESKIPDEYGEFSIQVPGAVELCKNLSQLPKEK